MTPRLAASFLLLSLSASCAQAPPPKKEEPPLRPEEIFLKMEQRLLDSTSLRIRAKCEQTDQLESGAVERDTLTAVGSFRGGGQLSVDIQGTNAKGERVGGGLVSDGTRISGRKSLSKPWDERDPPPELTKMLLTVIHWVGVTRGSMSIVMLLTTRAEFKISDLFTVSEFQAGETEGEVASMTYTIRDLKGAGMPVKLWYHRTTLKPLRRRAGVGEGKPGVAFDETYEDDSTGGSIPDAPFVLPDPDPASPRRWTHDGDVLIHEEREGPKIRFVLICSGVDVGTTEKGVVIKHGGITQNLSGNTGLMLVTASRTAMNSIPDGWDHDLVQEYLEHRAAHPGTRIREWLAETLRRRPAALLQELYGK